MEGAVPVVDAGADEIRQHVVAVGGAEQFPHRHAHLAGVVAGEDIAEIARGDAVVDLLAQADFPGAHQIAVSGDIVDHLGQNASPVDGVGGGEEIAPFRQGLPQVRVGENALDPALGVVEVALHGAHPHVAALLRHHLQLLNLAHAVFRVEDQNLCLLNVLKALQGGFSRVPGGGHQDTGGLLLPGFLQAGGQQQGQHLQGHVLKRAGGAVPQLQAPGVPVHLPHRRDRRVIKLVRTIGVQRVVAQLLRTEILQELSNDIRRTLLVGHTAQGFHPQRAQIGERHRRKQPAVPAQAHGDCFRRA